MQTQSQGLRRLGLVSILGSILCVILTPLSASIWNYGENWESATLLVRFAGPLLERGGFLTFGTPPVVYYTYGRIFFLVYLFMLIGLVAFHKVTAASVATSVKNVNARYGVLVIGLGIGFIADFGAYWGNNISASEFTTLQAVAFTIEMGALIFVLAGSVLYGRAILRAKIVPAWAAWLLILAGPVGAWWTCGIVGYIPHGTMLLFTIAMGVLGYFLWSNRINAPPAIEQGAA